MNGWKQTPVKHWLISWAIVYGGSFVIAETIDPEIGFYLALGVTGIILFMSPQSGSILGAAQKWLQSNAIGPLRTPSGNVPVPTDGGG